MLTRVFILGRPGSGKSSIAQHIYFALQRNGWYVEHLYDYKLLQEKFLQEINDNIPLQKRRFMPRGPESLHGFDVIDYTVLDEVLKDIAKKVDSVSKDALLHENILLLIEFARNNYRHALSLFDHALLRDAHILYINSSLEACMMRIDHRIDNQLPYGHYVSKETMKRYYYKDDWLDGQYLQFLQELEKSGIRIYPHRISNIGTDNELTERVDNFIKMHLLGETETIPVVHNTDAIPVVSPKPSQIESVKKLMP